MKLLQDGFASYQNIFQNLSGEPSYSSQSSDAVFVTVLLFPIIFLFVEVDLAFDEGLLSIHDVQVNHQGELQSQYEGKPYLNFLCNDL